MTGLRMDVELNMAAYHAVRSYKMQQADECWRLRCEVGNLKAAVGKLEAALRRACQFIAEYGSCPYDTFDLYEPWEESCHQKCSADIDRAECWRRYFEKGDDSR